MEPNLRDHLEDHRDTMVSFLQELVRIPTVNLPGENFKECAELLHQRLLQLGLDSEIIAVPAEDLKRELPDYTDYPRYNVVARRHCGAPETVHFNAHYDVVPVSGKWRHDPFSGAVANDFIFGRGTSDMKGAIAALCHALAALPACGMVPEFNIEVSFVCDEEIGGALGTRQIARQEYCRADYAVVCEGASGTSVGVGHNGVLWLEVAVMGNAAHASRPHQGVNAFEGTSSLVHRLLNGKEEILRRRFLQPNGEEMAPTLCLGGTFGQGPGGKTNIVPDNTWFTLDRRVLPSESLEQADQELQLAIESFAETEPDLEIAIKRVHGAESYFLDPDGCLPRTFARAVHRVLQDETSFSVTPGFTDDRFFGVDLGIPTIGYGPGGFNYHGIDESVSLHELLNASKVYATFLSSGVSLAPDAANPGA